MLANHTPSNVQQLESLSGLVERVTFHNENNGFCVLRLKVAKERDLITVVGHTPTVTPGEYASAQGVWVVDKEYGRQFRAEFLRIHAPNTLTGIEKYLGSGMVKGIGPFCAKTLVEAFGQEVFNVIEKHPERLKGLRGIGPKRIFMITSGWEDQKAIREIMVFLHSNGVSTSKAVRIYRKYGKEAIKCVEENPYRLAKDIRGIGFKSADTIAKNLGIDPISPLRARAGIAFTLSEASQNSGHCCLPRKELIAKAIELLNIPEQVINEAIDHEIAIGELVEADFPKLNCIYLIALYLAEKNIARNILDLVKYHVPWPKIDSNKALVWVEQKLKLNLANSQKEAISLALKSKVMVITGGPGVGKTTIIRAIISILQAKKVNIMLAAPTGRAAKRLSEASMLEAKTIHRLLEIDPSTMEFKRNEDNPLACDLLIVDECSMVDISLANNLIKAIAKESALILVGDVDQLPSVGPGAFLGDLINSNAIPIVRLTEIFRQASTSWIIKAAHQINTGRMPVFPPKGVKGDFYFIELDDCEKLASVLSDLVKRRLPQAYQVDPIKDIQILCPMNRSSSGAHILNEVLQQALNPPHENSITKFGITFSMGDKVMQIENNYEREVFNGDIGFVVNINKEAEELSIDFDGRIVIYPYSDLDEVVLCYATTIHKSQGSEYPIVVLPITMQHFMMLKRNLIYTGVTRGKKLVVLLGQKKALLMAIRGKQVLQRNTALKDFLIKNKKTGLN